MHLPVVLRMIPEPILVFKTQSSYSTSSLLYVFAVQVYKVLKMFA